MSDPTPPARSARGESNFQEVALADLISALSYALDLTGGQAPGWAVRTCLVGLRLADLIALPSDQRAALYYALLLKDSGCSSNAARVAQIFDSDDLTAKRESRMLDWASWTPASLAASFTTSMRINGAGQPWPRRLARTLRLGMSRRRNAVEIIHLRCERGADIAAKMGFAPATAQAIRSLDERWDGRGAPDGLRGAAIPPLARIVNVAQTLALFARNGADAALSVLDQRCGRWFDPQLVRAAASLRPQLDAWREQSDDELRRRLMDLDPGAVIYADSTRLDDVCAAFADVIDAKTPFTFQHSRGVAAAAGQIATQLGLDAGASALIRRAALLHDIGKLGVSNRILDKPGRLTADEWKAVKRHPEFTVRILERVRGWGHLAFIAGAHHERLNGSGYFQGLGAAQLPLPARVIAVADVYDALAARRPYREALPPELVLDILDRETPHALDPVCVRALRAALKTGERPAPAQAAAAAAPAPSSAHYDP